MQNAHMLFPYIGMKCKIALEFVCLFQDLFTFMMQHQNETGVSWQIEKKKPDLPKLKHMKSK